MFAAGFLFDFFTLQRIDAWLDLAFQLAYLAGLTGLLVFQHREAEGRWVPGRVAGRVWRYNVEALHFLYGGLLSAYVVLYFRSSTGARPALFLALLVGVMGLNEVPRIRRAGYNLRLGLYGFCVLSFLIYFIPIVLGRIDGWVFLLSLLSSAAVVWQVTRWLVPPRRAAIEAGGAIEACGASLRPPPACSCSSASSTCSRLIPPVPLSVQFQGIYHDIRREDGGYTLVYQEPPPWEFWRRDSRTFERREGDRLHYFARVFAPTGFRHRVIIRWEFLDPVERHLDDHRPRAARRRRRPRGRVSRLCGEVELHGRPVARDRRDRGRPRDRDPAVSRRGGRRHGRAAVEDPARVTPMAQAFGATEKRKSGV